jgi:hypothetical protein
MYNSRQSVILFGITYFLRLKINVYDFRADQTFLNLIIFIETINNIYFSK